MSVQSVLHLSFIYEKATNNHKLVSNHFFKQKSIILMESLENVYLRLKICGRLQRLTHQGYRVVIEPCILSHKYIDTNWALQHAVSTLTLTLPCKAR